ncbi:DUF3168 domain-containing protein [Jannaschia sp. S6380]|uniref:DUF3168 domain-containing protein n=1 Tax=Jannaschia sp. S6380 TaxID=2926408 RepID=UPI001FF38ECA|nr:DUF3168 domain-containing protein [Jannaschia sp. S6380]MCK0166891.1 DUF3168 domain-containing protein [Jannaschia sp. S6380]
MTYAMSESLQSAVYDRLSGDADLDALVAGAVFDSVPERAPDLFVALGPEKASDRSDATAGGAIHQVRISVVTRRQGFMAAKAVAGRVSDILSGAAMPLARGRLVSMRFLKAQAKRDEGEGTRRIDLWFRARLDDRN